MEHRRCPQCENIVEIGTTKFDDKSNVICPHCDGFMIVSTDDDTEIKVKSPAKTVRATTVYSHGASHTYGAKHMHPHFEGCID